MSASQSDSPRNARPHACTNRGGVARTTCHNHARTRLSEQPVLAVRGRVGEHEAARFVADALEEIHTFMHEYDLQPAGRPFSITTPTATAGTLDVEAGWPIDEPVAGTGRIHSGTLPATLAGHTGHPQLSDNPERDPTNLL